MLAKSSKFIVIAIFFGFSVVQPALRPSAVAADKPSTIAWGSDLNEALRQASQTGQPVLVHFYSDNCVPCKMLEAKAFRSPELGNAMARSVLPVKINYDQHRDIAQRYQITRFPTDLFLHPNGEELYRTVSPQDPEDYSKLLDRVAMKNRDWVVQRMSQLSTAAPVSRPFAPAQSDSASNRDGRPVATQSPLFQSSPSNKLAQSEANGFCIPSNDGHEASVAADNSQAGLFQLASKMSEVKENRYQRQNSRDPSMFNTMDGQTTSQMSGDPSQNNGMATVTMGGVFGEDSSFGLEGYCPVSLVTKKTWAVGQEAYSVKHRGRIYQCVSEEARTEFLQAPDRYSPVLSGYDLVHFLETGELVAGKREHGCEYLGRVFVFMNAANKLHFDTHATQYAQNLTPAMGLERIATGIQAPSMQR